MNANIKNRLLESKRREVTYEQTLEEAFLIEDLILNISSPDRKVHSNLIKLRKGTKWGSVQDRCFFAWHILIKPKLFMLLAALTILLSLELVAGELIILFDMKYTLFGLLPNTENGRILQGLLSVVLLVYESICVYYGLFHIQFISYYELHPNQ